MRQQHQELMTVVSSAEERTSRGEGDEQGRGLGWGGRWGEVAYHMGNLKQSPAGWLAAP